MLTPGDKYSRHSYGQIVWESNGMVTVRNEAGREWDISRAIFDDEFVLASPFQSEEKVTQTVLIQTIKENQRVAMTVNFNKQVDEDSVTDEIEILVQKGVVFTRRELKKRVKKMLSGAKRTLIGRHSGGEDDRGRMRFIDMTKGPRLVDPRGVNWAIINGVRYVKSS